jgi:hypothetical protein
MPHLVQNMRAPLQFPKGCEMIFQPRGALLDSEEVLFTSFEGGAAGWGVFVIIAMLDEEYRRLSRLRDAGSESFSFSFRICDRRTHGHSNETEPALIVLSVAFRGAKTETMAGHLPPQCRLIGSTGHPGRRNLYAPKRCDMSLQSREPLLANEKVLFKICELGSTARVGSTTVDTHRSHKLASCLNYPSSKSRHLGLCICDHKTHDFSNQRDPAFIGLSVALRRAEAELAESKHYALLDNRH